MMKLFSLVSLFVLLTSCATTSRLSSLPPDAQQWQQHQQAMQALSQWQLRGKVAMHNGHDGGQADVFWQQTDAQTYDIKLVAPFGAGSSLLTSRPGQVLLSLSNGETLSAENINQLLAEAPDWKFPVAGMQFWLLGIASPQSAVDRMRWDAQGRLALLEQDGWRIELQNYAAAGEYYLPRKIWMRRLGPDEMELKLVVRQWTLP